MIVSPWGDFTENSCECEGYLYRAECAHQKIAHQKLCGWSEIGFQARQQTPDQMRLMVCPGCGGQTMWAFKELEDGDTVV